VRLGTDVTDDDALRAWLAAGRATAALVRPDRIVQASSPVRRSTRRKPGGYD
jgi:inactivated superfamily I helicase